MQKRSSVDSNISISGYISCSGRFLIKKDILESRTAVFVRWSVDTAEVRFVWRTSETMFSRCSMGVKYQIERQTQRLRRIFSRWWVDSCIVVAFYFHELACTVLSKTDA